jgi:Holliday junction resolvase
VPFDRIAALQEFCTMFGAEPWIAVRFSREPWYFLNIEDLHKTEKNYILSLSRAKSVGLLFEEVTK